MKYTVRYAHLETLPELEKGHFVKRGDIIGRIGNTGASTGIHLHIDCVESYVSKVIHLWQMRSGIYTASPKQLNYFIDSELFDTKIHITSYYNDPDYMSVRGILHPAYDVVPLNRKITTDYYDIFWNRTCPGKVLSFGEDHGYGNYIQIGFRK